jgi:membrane protein DedA with SNARE-associated domain/rhodanese-related sulfurtransferase
MNETLEFLIRHGYALLFVWVFGEQAGLPIPAAPLMLAAGALAGTGHMHLGLTLGFPVLAIVITDALWYEIGRRKGVKVLQLLCRISLEPDSCMRRAQVSFERNGARVLLVAKFVPGLNAVAAPLAGIIGMGWWFALFDTLGALLWVGAFTITGYVFSTELQRIADATAFLGRGLLIVVVAAFAAYVVRKYYKRQQFLRRLRIDRITPEELKMKIEAGEDVIVLDLRRATEFEAQPETIPGAVHLDAAELEEAQNLIPRDREIVLFCACPNEATAAQMALLLRRKGITRIRPLSGGYEGWRSRGFPMSRLKRNTGEV